LRFFADGLNFMSSQGSQPHACHRSPPDLSPTTTRRRAAIFGDPQTNLFNPAGPMTCRADAQRLLNRWREHWATQGYGRWAIALRDAPQQII